VRRTRYLDSLSHSVGLELVINATVSHDQFLNIDFSRGIQTFLNSIYPNDSVEDIER
jgi:hypothetical protein